MARDITTIGEFFSRTDWAELRGQKAALASLSGETLQEDAIQGLLAFLDGIQDLAADHYGQQGVFAAKPGDDARPDRELSKPSGEEEQALIAAARDKFCDGSDDEIEIDDKGVRFSRGEDGSWVSAWVWVADDDD